MNAHPLFCRHHAHPKYWPTWLLIAISYGLSKLPYKMQMKLGRKMGRCLYHLMKRRRHIARRNIAMCFPHLCPQEKMALVKAHFQSLGMGIMEMAMGWWISGKKLRDKIHFKGFHHFEKAKQSGQPVLILGAHFTTLDLIGRILGTQYGVHFVAHPQHNTLIDAMRNRHTSREGFDLISTNEKMRLIKTLKSGIPVWHAPDHDHGPKESVFAPFFGNEAATISLTARLAKLTSALVLPIAQYRLSKDRGYELVVYPPLENFPTASLEKNATIINQTIEKMIAPNPAQYYWVHRRFKTRPQNAASVYE